MPQTPSRRLVDLVFIEPAAFVRVLDLDFQAQGFAVFHSRASTRWIHYLGTQVLVCALLIAAWNVSLGPLPLALLVMGFLAAWYLAMHRLVGLVAASQVAALGGLAFVAARAGVTSSQALCAVAVAALTLNVSHAVEPVPPMLTGRSFEPFPVFWRRASWGERLRLLALNLLYAPIEIVSAPRLFVVHTLRAMHRLGYAPGWAADLDARAKRILDGGP